SKLNVSLFFLYRYPVDPSSIWRINRNDPAFFCQSPTGLLNHFSRHTPHLRGINKKAPIGALSLKIHLYSVCFAKTSTVNISVFTNSQDIQPVGNTANIQFAV